MEIAPLRLFTPRRTLHGATSDSIGTKTKTGGIRNPKGPNEEKWKWAGTFNYCTHFSFNTLGIKSKPPSPTTNGTRRNWSPSRKVLTSSDVRLVRTAPSIKAYIHITKFTKIRSVKEKKPCKMPNVQLKHKVYVAHTNKMLEVTETYYHSWLKQFLAPHLA